MMLVPLGIWPPRFLVGSFAIMLIGFTFGTISALFHWLHSPSFRFRAESKKWYYVGIIVLSILALYWIFVGVETIVSSSWQFNLIGDGLYMYVLGITYLLAITIWQRSQTPSF